MKKIQIAPSPYPRLLAVLVGLMSLITLNLSAYTYNKSYTLNFIADSLRLSTATVNDTTYQIVTYDDYLNIGSQSGAPSLPYKVFSFSVPYNASDFMVSVSGSQMQSQTLDYHVIPEQPPHLFSDSDYVFMPPNDSIYARSTNQPPKAGEMVSRGYAYGTNQVITVQVNPIRYVPSSKTLRFFKKITVTVRYNVSDEISDLTPIVRLNEEARAEDLEQVKAMVYNPTDVEQNAFVPTSQTSGGAIQYPSSGGIPSASWNYLTMDSLYTTTSYMEVDPITYTLREKDIASYQYLIITPDSLKPAFRRLVALKRLKGYNAGIVTVEEIMNYKDNYQPFIHGDKSLLSNGAYSYIADSAGYIRQYLRFAYAHGTQYVMLGGKYVPYRYGHVERPNSVDTIHSNIPTDFYYSELTTNWNINNDNIYGDYSAYAANNSSIDQQPELFVGRLLATTTEHVRNYTDKLIRYELDPGHGEYQYLEKAFYFQKEPSHSYNRYEVQEVATNLSEFHNNKTIVFESEITTHPDAKDILTFLQQIPVNFIYIHAHGGPFGMLINNKQWPPSTIKPLDGHHYVYNATTPYVANGDAIDNLQNKRFPSIMYASSCTTMPYDTGNFPQFGMTLGESFTLGKDYGGIAYIGNTRLIYNPNHLGDNFSKYLLNNKYKPILGAAVANSKNNEITTMDNYSCLLLNNLLGDPAVELWRKPIRGFEDINIYHLDNAIIISGLYFSSDMTNVEIICSSNDIIIDTIFELNMNEISLNGINSNFNILIKNNSNYLPYICPLNIQNQTISREEYVITGTFNAGSQIDENRTFGNVIVTEGANYEVEVLNRAALHPGFKVEKGARFKIYPSVTYFPNE